MNISGFLQRSVVLFAGTAGLLAIAPPSHVLAQAGTPDMAECLGIAENRERLACYDRLSGRTAGAPPGIDASSATVHSGRATDPVTGAGAATAPPSLIDAAWGFNPDSERYILALYRPNNIQFVSYTDRVNDHPFSPLYSAAGIEDENLDSIEAYFQISFKSRLWTTDDRQYGLWVAYTQQSYWQSYNEDLSRPFRETNYMPEILMSYRPDISFGGFHWRLFNLGFAHQSNGRADPISRSWDRIIAEFGIENGNFALLVRPWYRVEENEEQDDNPDITDYMGHGDITAIYKWNQHSFSLMVRGNIDKEKGAAQLSWTTPRLLGPLRGYIQGFTGYGESMIDYNWSQNVIGVGVTVNDLLDR